MEFSAIIPIEWFRNNSDLKLLLLPGLDGSGELFAPFLELLQVGGRARAFSYPSDQHLDYPALAELAREELQSLPGRVVLLAESFSGPIAARLLNEPNVVASIFSTSFLRSPRPLLLKLLSSLPLAVLLRIRCPAVFVRLLCLGWHCPDSTVSLFQRIVTEADSTVLAHRLRLLVKLEELALLYGEKTPICYLQAKNDYLVPASCASEIQSVCPEMSVIVLRGHHFLLQGSPHEAVDAVCRFLYAAFGPEKTKEGC